MLIKFLMNRPVVTITMDDSLETIKNIFEENKFHHLLVIEEEQLQGVISDRDLLKSLSPNIGTLSETGKDLETLKKHAHQIMTRKPITLQTDASLQDAINIFNQYQISCIPIVDRNFAPVGIISWRDILKAMATPVPIE